MVVMLHGTSFEKTRHGTGSTTCKFRLHLSVGKMVPRMENQSYRRVPTILSSATSTFSTAELKAEVEAFETKITQAGQLGSLKSTFESIYGQCSFSECSLPLFSEN